MLQVLLCHQISDLEMDWTSSFLFQSDKTCDRSELASRSGRYRGEASRARICSSSKSASCGVAMLSVESRSWRQERTGCRTNLWHDPQFQWSDRLQCKSLSPVHLWSACRRSCWAHNLSDYVVEDNCHPLVVSVAVHRVLWMWSAFAVAGTEEKGCGRHAACSVCHGARDGTTLFE